MAIYDCFQYNNEDHILDLRLNILDKFVDFFIISESTKNHQGVQKKLNFKLKNFKKFDHKIKYIVSDYEKSDKIEKHFGGESLIEQHQRNNLIEGIKDASDDDYIILSDIDEIPNLDKMREIDPKIKFIGFSQKMFMYKINFLNINETGWIGSRVCKKKYLTSLQSLRNIKFKKYPFWRFDKFKKIQIIENGGWHFSFLQKPEKIVEKIKSYSHGEFNIKDFLDENKIKQKIEKGEDIFNRGYKIKRVEIDSSFPKYIVENKETLKEWII